MFKNCLGFFLLSAMVSINSLYSAAAPHTPPRPAKAPAHVPPAIVRQDPAVSEALRWFVKYGSLLKQYHADQDVRVLPRLLRAARSFYDIDLNPDQVAYFLLKLPVGAGGSYVELKVNALGVIQGILNVAEVYPGLLDDPLVLPLVLGHDDEDEDAMDID